MNVLEILPIRDRFPKFWGVVQATHKNMQQGHDIYHVQRVEFWAQQIAMAEWKSERIAILAGLAADCHNIDRILQKDVGNDNVTNEMISDLAKTWLSYTDCTEQELRIVVEAVIVHSGKNSPEHSNVTLALRDADRVVNLEIDVVIRSGQFYSDLPAVDYVNFLSDPEASYKKPKSCLYDISQSLEWVDPSSPFCVQTKLGALLAGVRARALEGYIEILKQQLETSGLIQNAK